jgi:hypothetical protein
MSSTIDEAIEKLYAAFAEEVKPSSIEACPCCVGEKELCDLVKTPLRQLTPEQLSSYASSVFLTAGSEEDFRYLIPRILDISIHDQTFWPDHEVICKSLANGRWLTWPEPLRASIMNVFSAALEKAISNDDGWKADELICGFGLSGMDLHPFLKRLEADDAKKTLIGFYERNSHSLMKGKLSNNFWAKHKAESAPVIDWFGSPKVVEIIRNEKTM